MLSMNNKIIKFLNFSVIDVYWIIKTCVYQQIIDAMEPTTRN